MADIDWKALGAQLSQDTPQSQSGDFMRGLKQSGRQLAGAGYGIIGLGGALTGWDAAKQWGLENAQEQFDASDALSQPSDTIENIESLGDAWRFLKHGVGYVGGQALPSIITGGIGAKLGQMGVQQGVKELAKQGVQKLVNREALTAAEAAALESVAKTQTRGALVGAGVSSYGQEAGSIYPEQIKEGYDNPWRAAGYAVPAAALDVIPEMGIVGKLFGRGATKVLPEGAKVPPLYQRMAKEGALQAAKEAPTEAAQSVFERLGAYQPLDDDEAYSDYLNSAALGALGGGLLGSLGGLRRPHIDDKSNPTNLLGTQQQQLAQPVDLQNQINSMLGIQPPMSRADRAQYEREINQMYFAPSEVYPGSGLTTPVGEGTLVEPPMSVGDVMAGRFGFAPPVEGEVAPKATGARAVAAEPSPVMLQLRDHMRAVSGVPDNATDRFLDGRVTRLLNGEPASLEDAAARLKAKITDALTSKRKKVNPTSVEQMIELHDNIVGLPGSERVPASDWLAKNAPVEDTETPTPPTADNDVPPPRPPADSAPEVKQGYAAALATWLGNGVSQDDLAALKAWKAKESVNDEDTGPSPLRTLAQRLGVSHQTVLNRANAANAKLEARAKQVGITLDDAHELLGLQSTYDRMGSMVDPTATTGYEGGQRVNAEEGEGEVEGEVGDQLEDGTLVGQSDASLAADPADLVERGSPADIRQVDIDEAREEYNSARQKDDPEWDNLSLNEQASLVQSYLSAYDNDNKYHADQFTNDVRDLVDNRQGEVNATEASNAESTEGQPGETLQPPGNTGRANPTGVASVEATGTTPATEAPEVKRKRSGSKKAAAPVLKTTNDRWEAGRQVIKDATGQDVGSLDSRTSEERDRFSSYPEEDQNAAGVYTAINGEGKPRQSTGGKAKNPTTPEHARKRLMRLFFSGSRFDQKVKILNSIEELDPELRKSLVDPENVKAFVAPDGKAYLFANNIEKGQELGVLLHEVGVHLGLEKLIGKARMQWLAAKVGTWAESDTNQQHVQIAKRAIDRVNNAALSAEKAGKPFVEDDYTHEIVAYFVEEAVNAGIDPIALEKVEGPMREWFRTLWAAAKAVLRKFGLERLNEITPQDIVDLIHASTRLELEGNWHGTASEHRVFNHAFMGSGEGAQSYGWGTYLAQRGGIARGYWQADVSRKETIDKDYVSPKRLPALKKFGDAMKDRAEKISDRINKRHDEGRQDKVSVGDFGLDWKFKYNLSNYNYFLHDVVHAVEMEILMSGGFSLMRATPDMVRSEISRQLANKHSNLPTPTKGSLMRVDVAAHEHELLDWDKPLSEQSAYVKDILSKAGIGTSMRRAEKASKKERYGDEIYKSLEAQLGSDKAASEYLDSLGIKGIKFLDAQSRVDPKRTIAAFEQTKRDLLEHRKAVEADSTLDAETRRNLLKDVDYTIKEYDDKIAEANRFTPTSNLVVFNDKNIHRVYSEVGANPNKIRYSMADTTKQQAKESYTNVRTFAKTHGLGVMLTQDIADLAAHEGFPEVRNYLNAVYEREAARDRNEQPVNKVLALYDKLPMNERGVGANSVNLFIRNATLAGKLDGIDKLSKEGQALVKAVFKHGKDILAAKQKLIEQTVGSVFDDRIAQATKQSEKDQLVKEWDAMLARFSKLMTLRESETYAHLARFGDYLVSAKSKEWVEAENNNDTKWMREHESDPAHRQVHFADTQGEADIIRDGLKGQFANGKLYAAPRIADKENFRDAFRAFPVIARRLRQLAPSDGPSPMERLLNDLYLSMLAESNARQTERRRGKITGASPDMMRAFATQGVADATWMANLEHSDKVEEQVVAMNKGAERDPAKLNKYLNEMLARHNASGIASTSRIVDKLKRMTSIWMLATSPTFYLQQLIQPWSISLPVIAGQHGYWRTIRALKQGYADISDLAKKTDLVGHMDWQKMPADVRDVLTHLSQRGAIDIGTTLEQGEWQFAGTNVASASWNKIDRALRSLNSRVESVNRAVTAVAAYRMELARNGGKKEEAAQYAEDMVRQTHGSYDGTNTPRYMKSPVAQMVSQYKRFQIIQLSLIARLAHNAFSKENMSDNERKIARKALLYIGLHTAALGGVLGMPGAQVVAALFAKLFHDPDEPDDAEYMLRKAIGDQAISDLLLKGVPAAMGVDLSNKLAMGQILSLSPFADFPTDRRSLEKYAFGMLGPAASLGAKGMDGLSMIYKGDVAKGLEQLLPNGIANVMKGARFANEGVTMRNGDVVIPAEEISFLEATLQGLGMPTTEITHRQWAQGVKHDFDTYYADHASQVKNAYTKAMKAGDSAGMADARQKWQELQDSRVRNGYKRQPLSDLVKAPQQQRKRERNVTNGLEYTKQNRAFVQGLGV